MMRKYTALAAVLLVAVSVDLSLTCDGLTRFTGEFVVKTVASVPVKRPGG